MANHNAGGNRRKSLLQHQLDGTFRKDRHGAMRNPEPPEGRPEMPEGLGEAGAEEWGRMVARLEASGTMWRVDDAAIYQYCRLYEETERVRVQQEEMEGSLRVLEENVGETQGPDLVQLFAQIVTLRKLVSKCTDQMRSGRTAIRQYLVEFGLTPASRGRVKLPPKAQEVDEFAAFAQQLKRVK